MYEHKKQPVIDRKQFLIRMLLHILLSMLILWGIVLFGVFGHMYLEKMDWQSALFASITLTSGVGLSIIPESFAGKMFASLYGILANYIYILIGSIIVAPILHRVLHHFHYEG